MSTANINMINILVSAVETIAIDRQVYVDPGNGTPVGYDSGTTLHDYNRNINAKHYNWQSEYQTIPIGMGDEPERFAQKLREALPEVNTLRLPFNEFSFNPDGSLPEQYARFIQEAAAQGFQLVFTYHGGDAQNIGNANSAWGHTALSNTQAYAALETNFLDIQSAWTNLLNWVDARPVVAQGTYGYEVMNEGAGYRHSITSNGAGEGLELADFVQLYADHNIAISNLVKSHGGDNVLVGLWGFNGDVATLNETQIAGQSALDYIRAGVGDALTWSAHLYPGWSGTSAAENPTDLAAVLDSLYSPVLPDGLLVTETNAKGTVDDYIGGETIVDVFTQTYDWFAENGVGLGWFTGAQTGGSSLVVIRSNGSTAYYHQHSLAHATNAYSLDEEDPALSGDDAITVTLVSALLRNEGYEETQNGEAQFDAETLLGWAFGRSGNDTLTGSDASNDFLYGGRGNDVQIAGGGDDFLFGQYGDDLLRASSGINHFFGGSGNDTLAGGTHYDQYTGGSGSDTFVVGDRGNDVVMDFNIIEDRLDLGGAFATTQDLIDASATTDADQDGQSDDLVITFANGSTVTLLNVLQTDLGALTLVDAGLSESEDDGTGDPDTDGTDDGDVDSTPQSGQFDGTEAGENVRIGHADDQGDQLSHGNDLVFMYGGNDLVRSGSGQDTVYGGDGDDWLRQGGAGSRFYGGAGNDTIQGGNRGMFMNGGAGDDHLIANMIKGGGHILTGGVGRDTFEIAYSSFNVAKDRADRVTITDFDPLDDTLIIEGLVIDLNALPGGILSASDISGTTLFYGTEDAIFLQNYVVPVAAFSSIAVPIGTSGDDSLTGSAYDEALSGQEGNDTLDGLAGNDTLFGGAGDDRLLGQAGFDRLLGGEGDDHLDGGGQADNLWGGTGDDTMLGGNGFDRLFGQEGDDHLFGGATFDSLYGEADNDRLFGQGGNDGLWGGGGNDFLDGGAANDRLIGGAGFDTLLGSTGDDTLTGAFNADIFLFSDFGGGFGNDVIEDFDANNDFEKIDLRLVSEITDFADLTANHMAQLGTDVIIDDGVGNTIALRNVQIGDLMDGHDFLL